MSDLHFIDTNVLLYSISGDPEEAPKRERAIELLEAAGGALSVQVLQEFYVQATRTSRADLISHDIAVGLIRSWTRFVIQETSLSIVEHALDIKARHGFSYWDSAIIAAARALGCRELFTEDMTHGQEVDGVLIIDPFR